MEKIDRTPNALLPNLIMNLNALDGKLFKSIRARLYINKFKKNLRSDLKKSSYSATDIYDFLLFLNNARKFNLIKGLEDEEIWFDVFTTTNSTNIVSGSFKTRCPYENGSLDVVYKPIIDIDYSIIKMHWTCTYDDPSKPTSMYSSEVEVLAEAEIDDRLSQTKILQYGSTKILRVSIGVCIEVIAENLIDRYCNK